MSNAIFFNSYKIKKGSSVPEFKQAVSDLITNYASKQPGALSFALLSDGEQWADFGIFETIEDAINFENPTGTNEWAEKFYSFLNFSSCVSRMFTVEGDCQVRPGVPGAVTLVTFKLKKDASVPDFLLAKDKVYSVLASTHEGCIASKLLTNGKEWADLVFWKSIDDTKNAAKFENDVFREYFSFIGQVTSHRHFAVEQMY